MTGPHVRCIGVTMPDPGRGNVLRESSKAERPMVTAGIEGGRSAGVRVMGLGGVEHAEVQARAMGFPHPGRDGSQPA